MLALNVQRTSSGPPLPPPTTILRANMYRMLTVYQAPVLATWPGGLSGRLTINRPYFTTEETES